MGMLFVLLILWLIVFVSFLITENNRLKRTIMEMAELAKEAKNELEEVVKDYETNYQGQNENETYTWKVENKK